MSWRFFLSFCPFAFRGCACQSTQVERRRTPWPLVFSRTRFIHMGLIVDLRGQRQAHRFWKRKLEIASKVTDPLSRSTWPVTSSISAVRDTAEQKLEEIAAKHREPHLFGAGASTDPPSQAALPPPAQHRHATPEMEKRRERQRRYKQQLDAQVESGSSRKLLDKTTAEGAGYDGGLFRRLGEHVVHGRTASQFDLKHSMLDDLNEQIRLKEERLVAEYEAGQRQDAEAELESFWGLSADAPHDADGGFRRFNIRSLMPKDQNAMDARQPPWAIDDSVPDRSHDRSRIRRLTSSITDRCSASRHLFSESSERLDKILLDFLDAPIKL